MAEARVALPVVVVARPPVQPPVALTQAGLGRLLGALASRPGPVPKYGYPSAGTLYPVQTYLVLRRTLGDLAEGSYYHNPDAHALVALSCQAPAAPDGSEPHALLALVAQRAAIVPIYGDQAEAFWLLEAGYMQQALLDAAGGLALRDAGDPARHGGLTTAFALDTEHMPLVCWAVGETI